MIRRAFRSVFSMTVATILVSGGCQEAPPRMALNPTRSIGPYSSGIATGSTLFSSGLIGLDPKTGEIVKGGIEVEAKQALVNLGAVLRSGNLEYSDVVTATVYLTDINDYDEMNKVYVGFFKEPFPARTAVEVKSLPRGAKFEISVIAVSGGKAGYKANEAASRPDREKSLPAFAD